MADTRSISMIRIGFKGNNLISWLQETEFDSMDPGGRDDLKRIRLNPGWDWEDIKRTCI